MSVEAPAPHRHVSSKPVSADAASRILETYLSNSEMHPHLHPDALIAPTGVTFSSHGGPMGGVVMHNLRRVAAGLRGEYLEPEATPEPEDGDADANESGAGKKGRKGGAKKPVVAPEEWQDLAEYEQEGAGLEVGDVGERSNFVAEGGEEPGVEATDGSNKRKTGEEDGKVDKEARKKAKKERAKQEKKEKEKKRAQKSE